VLEVRRRTAAKYSQTRCFSSAPANLRTGSATARLACIHFGSIRFSHGAFTGSPRTRIAQPPSRPTRALWASIYAVTRPLTCQLALSHTSANTFLPSAASSRQTHPRKSSVT